MKFICQNPPRGLSHGTEKAGKKTITPPQVASTLSRTPSGCIEMKQAWQVNLHSFRQPVLPPGPWSVRDGAVRAKY